MLGRVTPQMLLYVELARSVVICYSAKGWEKASDDMRSDVMLLLKCHKKEAARCCETVGRHCYGIERDERLTGRSKKET